MDCVHLTGIRANLAVTTIFNTNLLIKKKSVQMNTLSVPQIIEIKSANETRYLSI